jgi:Tfp pilus assembly PilM family ATPase
MISFSKSRTSVACMIDDRFIRFFHVAKNRGHAEIQSFFSERIPDHLFDEDNNFTPDDLLVKRVSEIRKKHKFSKIHLVVPDKYVTVFHTTIPVSVFETSKRSFQYTLEHYLEDLLKNHPEFSESDMIADYDLIDQSNGGYDVHVAVARPTQFKHIPELFESAGFHVDHIDIIGYAMHRIAKNLNDAPVYGTISIGTHTTAINVVSSGNVIAATWVNVGSSDLLKVVQETLKISHTESERIISQYGILHTHPDKQVLGKLLQTLEPVIAGIRQVFESCSEQKYNHSFYHSLPEQWYVYGIGASISGVAQYVGIKANVSLRPLDVIPTEFIDEEILLQIPIELLPLYLPVMSTAVHYLAE